MKARLIALTQVVEPELLQAGVDGAEALVAYCARVSNPTNQLNSDYAKLLAYCRRHKHWSVFEMASAVVEVETTRDIARQILRHRSFSFQEFCVSGDTKISCVTPCGRVRLKAIRDLYTQQYDTYSSRRKTHVRALDEQTQVLVPARILEVCCAGVKPVLEVVLTNGKRLRATKEHKLLTKGGFVPLEQLTVGSVVGINGVTAHQDREWMSTAKVRAIESGKGVKGIAEDAGISYHTARKWLRVHELSFTKEEVARYTRAWNKGLPAEKQPGFGKHVTEETRERFRASARRGQASHLYRGGTTSWRRRVAAWCTAYRRELLAEQQDSCAICGSPEPTDIDHIVPVSQDPSRALDRSNLQIVCRPCHKRKSAEEIAQTVRWAAIESITACGEADTYDIWVDHVSHNYVANGFIVHNSQRYANPNTMEFETREARLQDAKNRQNSLEVSDQELTEEWHQLQDEVLDVALGAYVHALDRGIAKEVARAVLPEGLTPSKLYLHGTLRTWLHYLEVRLGPETQKEHRDIARECTKALAAKIPMFAELLKPKPKTMAQRIGAWFGRGA
jgi:thymidylate synthase (FAD)